MLPIARRTVKPIVKKPNNTSGKASALSQAAHIGVSKTKSNVMLGSDTQHSEAQVRSNGSKLKFTSNTARVADLPDFAIDKWCRVFLPTLYNKFFVSSKPFSDFLKGSDKFVSLLQVTVDEVYPKIEYLVT